MLLAMATPATAGPLLVPRRPAASAAGVRSLRLAPGALAALRRRPTAVVSGVPLGGGTADLELMRVDVFAPGARLDVVGADGVRHPPVPAEAHLAGGVAGEPGSFAVLTLGADTVRGFVRTAGTAYRIGPDGRGGHESAPIPEPPDGVEPVCGNAADGLPAGGSTAAPSAPAPGAAIPPDARLEVDVAIDTDYEFWAAAGSDQAAIDYVTALVAAANVAYERDVGIELRISYLRLWSTPADPWTATDSLQVLYELRSWWQAPEHHMDEIAGPRALTHLLSGRLLTQNVAGRAFIDTLCNPAAAYGYTRTGGRSVDATAQTFTHELGHGFGSPHSHCYHPPLDQCWNQEPGCYAGPVVPIVGTVMSYCHAGGLGRVLAFHDTVKALVRARAEASACATVLCDEAALDPAVCDDGDRCTDDVCDGSAGCIHVPVPGCCARDADCDDGDPCSLDTCGADGQCASVPAADGTPCPDDRCADGAETCAAGVCVAGPPPTGRAGLDCALTQLEQALAAARPGELRRRTRRRLRRLLGQARARLGATVRAERTGRPRQAARLLRATRRALARFGRLVARAGRPHRRRRIAPGLAAELEASLGLADASLSDLHEGDAS